MHELSSGTAGLPKKRKENASLVWAPKSRLQTVNAKFSRAWVALFMIWTWGEPALADFRVCNKTRSLINVAIGTDAGKAFATEGWWTVVPRSCATPIREPLTGRYVYLYATDIDGSEILQGAVSMCVSRGRFKVYGTGNCWRRGLEAVRFAEIDTSESADWTTILIEE